MTFDSGDTDEIERTTRRVSRDGLIDTLRLTGPGTGSLDVLDGAAIIGALPDFSGDEHPDYVFNGEGRGLLVQSNPNNSGLPDGITLMTGDAGDESGSGFNAGYQARLNFGVDPSLNGTARRGAKLTYDKDGDFKVYGRVEDFTVDEGTATLAPAHNIKTARDDGGGQFFRHEWPNTETVEMRGGTQKTSNEGHEWRTINGAALYNFYAEGSRQNELRFNFDDTDGWGLRVYSGRVEFKDFGNGYLPTFDFNGGDGIPLGIPRIATRTDIPTSAGVSHLAVATDNDELVWTEGSDRYYVSGTSF